MEEVVAELRGVLDEFGGDRLLIGEIYLPLERLMRYYGRDLKGAHLPFNFSLLGAAWNATTLAGLIREYETSLPPGGWPNWVLGNHDWPRIAGRIGRDQARVAAMLLLTLRGTPTMYYGDEIAMVQVPIPPHRIRDPFQKNVPQLIVGRDGSRTPMQWDAGHSAGFSCAEPWLPLAPDFQEINVACERADPASIYNLYRALLALRRTRPALARGSCRLCDAHAEVLLFARERERESLVVALNFADAPATATLSEGKIAGRVLLSTQLDRAGEPISHRLDLHPNEGVIVEL